MSEQKKIIIIGAGIAGLTAGLPLCRSGKKVIILEKEETCGGLARSVEFKGNTFDFGPHRFHTNDSEVLNFINEILENDKLTIKRNSKVWLFNHYHNWPLDYHSLFKLPYKIMFKSFMDLFNRTAYSENTFENYVKSKYGETLYKYFFEPYTKKFLNYPPSELHSDWGKTGIDRAVITNEVKMNNLFDVAKSALLPKPVETDFIYPVKNGIQFFCDKMREKILAAGGEIITGEYPSVIKIDDSDIDTVITNKNRILKNISKIIWTAPITDLMNLLDIQNINLEFLSSVFYNVILKSNVLLEYQWCYYGSNDIFFNRISMPHTFSENNLNSYKKQTLCIEIAAADNTVIFNNPDSVLIKIIDDMVKAKVIDSVNDIDDVNIVPVKNTYPIYKKNYLSEMQNAKKRLTGINNLTLLGRSGEFWYNNMDHSIKNALELCKQLF